MKIAGRCECGFALELVAKKPDEHMRCIGLRWCGVCGEVAAFRRDCKRCKNRRISEYRKRNGLTPRRREAQRIRNTAYGRRVRRGDHPVYQRAKARQRERYAKQRVETVSPRTKHRGRHPAERGVPASRLQAGAGRPRTTLPGPALSGLTGDGALLEGRS